MTGALNNCSHLAHVMFTVAVGLSLEQIPCDWERIVVAVDRNRRRPDVRASHLRLKGILVSSGDAALNKVEVEQPLLDNEICQAQVRRALNTTPRE